MLEITGDDISRLKDSDLRSLIGLLCEAELRFYGLPTAGVTWGGHQNAPDGGFDVRVEITTIPHQDSFIPRATTGFQVKATDMPRASIIKEMKPSGKLRPEIADLDTDSGAYIIVSSKGSTSHSALLNRKRAMQEALGDTPDPSNIKLDFYDRGRIATWVRCHPSLILWIRKKLGRPISGWNPYGNWAGCPGGAEEVYLLDDKIRLHNGSKSNPSGMSVVEGINCLRTVLGTPQSSVRLTGLSGLGKTRLLQALFDERIGENVLNKSQVYYTNINENPNPSPGSFAEAIIALQIPAIIVVDNCPPDLHRLLTTKCTDLGSLISLITVEYDVREDLPEETEVFSLEASSDNLIEQIILARFKHITQIDASTIAESSGGNARLAIAVATTIRPGGSLSCFKDEDLFTRLFHQRNNPSDSLIRTAEACSLVYSFNCQTDDDSNMELSILASLAGKSVRDLFADVNKLKRRDLVQQRSKWRAVLPHALANWLALGALENIPVNEILNAFMQDGSNRLLLSFSKRLSFLHESELAQGIADKWLSEEGLLNDISNLDTFNFSLFRNIAPIKPEATLSAIERAAIKDWPNFLSRENRYFSEFTRLLRSLAYDEDLFQRSVDLLCQFALSEDADENRDSIRDVLKSLFYMLLSGTHSSVEQRLSVIQKLMNSGNVNKQHLGITLLSAALESSEFSQSYGFKFGARSRDFGYDPKSKEEVHQWFAPFIDYSTKLACGNNLIGGFVKELLAKKFSGLWINGAMHEELEIAVNQIGRDGPWILGWLAVKNTIRLAGKNQDIQITNRLHILADLLKPKSLIERARLYLFAPEHGILGLTTALNYGKESNESIEATGIKLQEKTRSVGEEVAREIGTFKNLLPDIVSTDCRRSYYFGQGLAKGASDPLKMWQDFTVQSSLTGKSKWNRQVLLGFLKCLSSINPIVTEKILDDSVTDPLFVEFYPELEASVALTVQDIERVKKFLAHGKSPIQQLEELASSRLFKDMCDEDFIDFSRLLSAKSNDAPVAIAFLYFRILSQDRPLSNEIILLGQDLLLKICISRKVICQGRSMDTRLSTIIKSCFKESESKSAARIFCIRLAQAFASMAIHLMDCYKTLQALAMIQPSAFLDGFIGDDRISNQIISRYVDEQEGEHDQTHSPLHNPLDIIDDDLILDWCEVNPNVRYLKVASAISFFVKNEKGTLKWTPLALQVISKSPDPIVVLNQFRSRFRPMVWSGSRSAIMATRLGLVTSLKTHKNVLVSEWADKEELLFHQEIESLRQKKIELESNINESFE